MRPYMEDRHTVINSYQPRTSSGQTIQVRSGVLRRRVPLCPQCRQLLALASVRCALASVRCLCCPILPGYRMESSAHMLLCLTATTAPQLRTTLPTGCTTCWQPRTRCAHAQVRWLCKKSAGCGSARWQAPGCGGAHACLLTFTAVPALAANSTPHSTDPVRRALPSPLQERARPPRQFKRRSEWRPRWCTLLKPWIERS